MHKVDEPGGGTTLIGWLTQIAGLILAAVWVGVDPVLKALFLLSLLDALAGIVAAAKSPEGLNLNTATRGIDRKVMMAILVTASVVIQVYVSEQVGYQIPLTPAVAGFYAAREFLSIMKHAAALGLGIPGVLIDVGERIEQASGGGPRARPEGGITGG